MSYQSVNRYDGKVLQAFEELSEQQLETSIETAAACFASSRADAYPSERSWP
jgi:succinate-semialdehyde dehydrogenase / glutarate-semialdehyde dehydrogenase